MSQFAYKQIYTYNFLISYDHEANIHFIIKVFLKIEQIEKNKLLGTKTLL